MNNQLNKIAIIGTGRLGAAFANMLFHKKFEISAVIDKNIASAKRIASLVNSYVYSEDILNLPAVDIILIAVWDDEITKVVNALTKILQNKKITKFIFHTSGALSSEIFKSLRDYDVSCASIHPMQTFEGKKDDYKKLFGCHFGVEGDKNALRVAKKVIHTFGGNCILIPQKNKVLYHLACSCASNYLNALISIVINLMKELGFSEKQSITFLLPLIKTTLDNIHKSGTEQSLTGPISRGDVATIKKHLKILSENFCEYKQIYQQMGKIVLNYQSVRSNLSEDVYKRLSKLFGS